MNQKGFIKDVIIIVLAILLLGGGYFYFSKKPAYAPAGSSNIDQKVADETADWKVYTDIKWGFSFKYPENYRLNSYPLEKTDNFIDATLIQISNPEIKEPGQVLLMNVIKQPFEVSGKIYNTIEEFVKNYSKTSNLKTVYLGSDKFVEIKSVNTEMGRIELRSLFAFKDSYVFQILVSLKDENYSKIADSFRFTK